MKEDARNKDSISSKKSYSKKPSPIIINLKIMYLALGILLAIVIVSLIIYMKDQNPVQLEGGEIIQRGWACTANNNLLNQCKKVKDSFGNYIPFDKNKLKEECAAGITALSADGKSYVRKCDTETDYECQIETTPYELFIKEKKCGRTPCCIGKESCNDMLTVPDVELNQLAGESLKEKCKNAGCEWEEIDECKVIGNIKPSEKNKPLPKHTPALPFKKYILQDNSWIKPPN